MSKIIVAESAGFCFGVNRAINILYKLIDENKPACTLGPIIHNMQMVNELREKGVRTIDKISEAKENETIVIRSHGVPQSIVDEINEKKVLDDALTERIVEAAKEYKSRI